MSHSNKVYDYTNSFHFCGAPIKCCRPSYDGRVFAKYYLLLFAEIFRRVRLSIRASGVLHILNFAILEANNSALLFFSIYASLGPLSSNPGS